MRRGVMGDGAGLVLTLAFLAAVAGVPIPSMAAAGERGPIKIGMFVPLTGTFAQPGRDQADGFQFFWDEVGNQVAGRKVEILVEDTEGLPATALTKIRRLVEQQHVHTVVGGHTSATGYAIAPYLEQHQIPTLYPVMAPDDITQRKPVRWVVRTAHTGSQISHPLGDYAYRVMGLRRVATVSMDFSYGWEANGGFQRVFEDSGGKVVQRLWAPLNTQDFAPYVNSLRKDIDGVYATMSSGLSTRFITQWSAFGLHGKLPLIGVGTLTDENVLKGLGDEALGIISSLHYSAVLDNPANRTFAAGFERKYHRSSSLYSMQGYTAARFYFEALKAIRGEAEDRQRFLQALRKVELPDDPRGPMKMDELGNPIQNVYIRKVERRGGQLQNTVIYTYPMVSQFWTYSREDYLKQPLYDRNVPPCRFCE